MSTKSTLKKYLQTLSKEQIIEIIIDAYQNSKPIKEYFDFFLNPNEEEKIKNCKKIIYNEFNLDDISISKFRFSVAKKAINEFASLKPTPMNLADVLLYLPECACEFTYEYGDMNVPYYNAIINNFSIALEFLKKNGLLAEFKQRCLNCVNWAEPCGYGFADEMWDIYCNYYPEDLG